MKIEAILTVGLALYLAGCVLHGTPKATPATPAAPVAVAPPAPPSAPPPQLSIPQTNVELSPPQPLTADAVATTEPPEEPVPVPAAPKPPTRTGTRSAPAHTEPPAQPSATTGPPAEAPAAERPPVGELVSNEEKQQLLVDMQKARQDARHVLDTAGAHRLSRQRQQLKQSVESFLKLSQEAENRGDLRQARELAGRAADLAKGLQQ